MNSYIIDEEEYPDNIKNISFMKRKEITYYHSLMNDKFKIFHNGLYNKCKDELCIMNRTGEMLKIEPYNYNDYRYNINTLLDNYNQRIIIENLMKVTIGSITCIGLITLGKIIS